MKRMAWTIALGIAVVGSFLEYAWSQCSPGYSAGSSSIGPIQTLCVEEYPAPQTRTDVGIGEQVACSIDPSTWQAYAIYTDSYCNSSQVSDPLGSITWTVSGQGSVYPTTGDSTTLTIDLADEDNVVTVIATATDWLAVNAAVQKQQAMNAKVPTGALCLQTTDNPPAAWQQGNANFGAQTAFLFQIQPNTVDFSKTQFQVPYGADPNFAWPNGKKDPVAATTWGPWKPQSVGATVNLQTVTIVQDLNPVGLLAGVNFNYTTSGSLQYKGVNWNGLGDFTAYYSVQGAVNPNPPPAQNQMAVGTNMSNNGMALGPFWGGYQGSWK